MKRSLIAAINVGFVVLGMAGCSGTGASLDTNPPTVHAAPPKKTAMEAFHSEQELKSYLQELAKKQVVIRERAFGGTMLSAPVAKTAIPTAAGADKSDSVTNVQHEGVDEGGIVKVHGDHLVVLRRGRLFTVAIGGDDLTPISCVNAFGLDIDPRGTWYDEMLVSENTVVVIGYSYERGGTEVGLFHIDGAGNLAYRST